MAGPLRKELFFAASIGNNCFFLKNLVRVHLNPEFKNALDNLNKRQKHLNNLFSYETLLFKTSFKNEHVILPFLCYKINLKDDNNISRNLRTCKPAEKLHIQILLQYGHRKSNNRSINQPIDHSFYQSINQSIKLQIIYFFPVILKLNCFGIKKNLIGN